MNSDLPSGRKVLLFVGIPLLIISVIAGILMIGKNKTGDNAATLTEETTSSVQSSKKSSAVVTWSYDGSNWKASSTPPACPEPKIPVVPANITLASEILSPGQERTGGYKPHGGFNFYGKKNNEVQVVAPMDAVVTRGSRYIEAGETQHLFEFVNSCGIMYRLDHLLTLGPGLQAIADTLPAAKVDDSRTTNFTNNPTVKQGDVLATAVGFEKLNGTGHTGFDFGVYDLRTKNAASQDAVWAAKHQNEMELAGSAVCWFDWFDAATNAQIQTLLQKDTQSSRVSDYCK